MVSFDIFDTLVTRTTANPWGIFAIMQQVLNRDESYRYISDHIRANFYTLRIHAEELARYNNMAKGIEEVTLKEIYKALAMSGGLTAEATESLLLLECKTEQENILPINKNIELLKENIKSEERVVLISDMYLPLNVITGILESIDEVFKSITVYVSSELKARKTSGEIYKKVKEIENIEYSQWTHYGNDLQQDVIKAEMFGIRAIHLKWQELTCYEKKFSEILSGNVSFQLMAGLARYARDKAENKVPYQTGASICGPILYEYAGWIIRESVRKGIKRLYFIARDGFLVKVAADKIIKAGRMDIETKYIYGSRKAWRMCSLTFEDFNLVQMLRWSYVHKIHTSGDLADVLEMDYKKLLPFLPYACRNERTELSQQALHILVQRLEQNLEFRGVFLRNQEEKRKLTGKYIQQEVDISDENFAFVDVSGGGLTQGCLKKIMSDFYEKPIQTFFFKLDRVNLVKDCIFYVFFPSAIKNNLVIEMICRAPHGQTLGYKVEKGRVIPVFDYFENEKLVELGFAQMQLGMEKYIEYMLMAGSYGDLQDSVGIVEKYLMYVAEAPDKDVLEYFASYPNNESGREHEITEYAPKLSKEDILNIFVRRMPGEHISSCYKGTDIAYSVLRCSEEERAFIDKCKREFYAGWAKHERAEKIRTENIEIQKYGKAAYYPCELLEKDIILYGAGKMGLSLYKKILDTGKSNIIRWVDKNAGNASCPYNVETPKQLMETKYDQIVIAVINFDMAEQIRQELIELGISEELIFWVQAYGKKYVKIKWE